MVSDEDEHGGDGGGALVVALQDLVVMHIIIAGAAWRSAS